MSGSAESLIGLRDIQPSYASSCFPGLNHNSQPSVLNLQISTDPTAKALPPRPPSKQARWSTDSWASEILSCVFSLAATAAVAAVLLVYDNKPRPKLLHNIGLNSVVAILGTVSKSALLLIVTSTISQFKWLNFNNASGKKTLLDLQLHDEASRGPWGSFLFLVNWKGLFWAKLGAFVTILSIAFDPVYQALITIDQRAVYHFDSNAVARQAQSLNDPSRQMIDIETRILSNTATLAVSNAILSDASKLTNDPSCPTGNCTFPVFSSLGFCSNCNDITQFLQQNAKCAQILSGVDKKMNCTYQLPPSSNGLNYKSLIIVGNRNIQNGSFNFDWTYGGPNTTIGVYKNAPSLESVFLTMPYRKEAARDTNKEISPPQNPFKLSNGDIIPSSISQIALIKTSSRRGSMDKGFVYSANICALSVCAREYNISVISSLLRSETLSTSYSNLTWWRGPDSPYAVSSYHFIFPNKTNDFTFSSNVTTKHIGSTFEYGMEAALRIVLEGNSSFGIDASFPDSIIASSTSVLQAGLNASVDIPKTMDRVAIALTNHLTDLGAFNIYGQSESLELYVRVSWAWLILPVLSVFLGTVSLISVIKASRERRFYVWKSSELPLLFHGLDFPLYSMTDVYKVSEMEAIAAALRVKLEKGPKGLQLQRKPG